MYQPIPTPAPRSQIPVPDPYNRDLMVRAPLWLILLLILAIVGIGVYGYFTTPLPFGLSSVIRTPGTGAPAASSGAVTNPARVPPRARAPAAQPLALGAVAVNILGVQRQQDLNAGGGRGPLGTFTLVLVSVHN